MCARVGRGSPATPISFVRIIKVCMLRTSRTDTNLRGGCVYPQGWRTYRPTVSSSTCGSAKLGGPTLRRSADHCGVLAAVSTRVLHPSNQWKRMGSSTMVEQRGVTTVELLTRYLACERTKWIRSIGVCLPRLSVVPITQNLSTLIAQHVVRNVQEFQLPRPKQPRKWPVQLQLCCTQSKSVHGACTGKRRRWRQFQHAMPAQACYATGRAPCIACACESGALYEASSASVLTADHGHGGAGAGGSAVTDRRG